MQWSSLAYQVDSGTCVFIPLDQPKVFRSSRCPDFPCHFIKCHWGPQKSVWIMQVFLFPSVHINRGFTLYHNMSLILDKMVDKFLLNFSFIWVIRSFVHCMYIHCDLSVNSCDL